MMVLASGNTAADQACDAVFPLLKALLANWSPRLLTTRQLLQNQTGSLLAVAQGNSGFGSSPPWVFQTAL